MPTSEFSCRLYWLVVGVAMVKSNLSAYVSYTRHRCTRDFNKGFVTGDIWIEGAICF